MKRILFAIVLVVISMWSFGMSFEQYVQLHRTSDGGYLDTPSFVSRCGNASESVYLQLSSEFFEDNFDPISYFENYLEVLKSHASYFSTFEWIDYSLRVSQYLRIKGKKTDFVFLKAISDFLDRNLEKYSKSPLFSQIVADELCLKNFLGEDIQKSSAYVQASNILKKSFDEKLPIDEALNVLSGFAEANVSLPKIEGIQTSNTKLITSMKDSYDYWDSLALLKLGLLKPMQARTMLKDVKIDSPRQLYAYVELCEKLGISYVEAKPYFEKLKEERAPLGGFYEKGKDSSIGDTYWATRIMVLMGKSPDDEKYWKNFANDVLSTVYVYPANVLSKYLVYAYGMNKEFHILSSAQVKKLSGVFSQKMNEAPVTPSYYLASFNFDYAFDVFHAMQLTNYKGKEAMKDLRTVLGRLFTGLNSIDKSKRDLGYYYSYARLLVFSKEFGYDVGKKTPKEVEKKLFGYLQVGSYTDLNLLKALLELEKDYALPINKNFYVRKISTLKDQITGGYFYNTNDGILSFRSTFMANEILREIEKTL